ncbi:hypothetical protein ABIF21_000141 [Bradyrhizobium elkanii]|uniref:hypothetical protein n=1 Tax=Bradyrhizobium elkanii TaxID=29448 RepID=UPI0004BCD13A|nr:hypothetical protein [Bradyrhizobium elkanii]NWL43820.1 hypothetical protein [Bradyrhizobium elkanii]RYM19355.1 hypothetical protein EWH13_28765 [Bradyrhizobium elkanii]
MAAARETSDHRRHALQMVCQLPENTEDALAVLRAAERLVTGFLAGDEPERKSASVVTLIGGNDCA